jgi:hypothetical protein
MTDIDRITSISRNNLIEAYFGVLAGRFVPTMKMGMTNFTRRNYSPDNLYDYANN